MLMVFAGFCFKCMFRAFSALMGRDSVERQQEVEWERGKDIFFIFRNLECKTCPDHSVRTDSRVHVIGCCAAHVFIRGHREERKFSPSSDGKKMAVHVVAIDVPRKKTARAHNSWGVWGLLEDTIPVLTSDAVSVQYIDLWKYFKIWFFFFIVLSFFLFFFFSQFGCQLYPIYSNYPCCVMYTALQMTPSLGSMSGSNDLRNGTPSPSRINSNRDCDSEAPGNAAAYAGPPRRVPPPSLGEGADYASPARVGQTRPRQGRETNPGPRWVTVT